MTLALFLLMLSSPAAFAGTYGTENWGSMYWGDNAVSAPTSSPTISSVVADSDQIKITLTDFPIGTGEDGWSAVRSYVVTCGETTVETSETSVTISGLQSETEYSCSVTAVNDLGNSPMSVQVVVTSEELQRLNLILICSAIDCTNRTET